tara:strand:+ start:536 stop:733 length:198 start_codon:yes stop_codon:yes gene_type:complete
MYSVEDKNMQIGNLVKHITQDKWGVVLNIVDFSEHEELNNDWVEVLWSDEECASMIWDDLIKVIA